jgi:hypothetical protein
MTIQCSCFYASIVASADNIFFIKLRQKGHKDNGFSVRSFNEKTSIFQRTEKIVVGKPVWKLPFQSHSALFYTPLLLAAFHKSPWKVIVATVLQHTPYVWMRWDDYHIDTLYHICFMGKKTTHWNRRGWVLMDISSAIQFLLITVFWNCWAKMRIYSNDCFT